MNHRHLDTTGWSKAAIDSVIEYGDLPDWRELFHAAASNEALARSVLEVARAHYVDGRSELAKGLIAGLLAKQTPSPPCSRQ